MVPGVDAPQVEYIWVSNVFGVPVGRPHHTLLHIARGERDALHVHRLGHKACAALYGWLPAQRLLDGLWQQGRVGPHCRVLSRVTEQGPQVLASMAEVVSRPPKTMTRAAERISSSESAPEEATAARIEPSGSRLSRARWEAAYSPKAEAATLPRSRTCWSRAKLPRAWAMSVNQPRTVEKS